MKRKINLNKEAKDLITSEIKRYFSKEREEDIGDLAATILLDFLCENIGPIFYNQGIKDSIIYINDKLDDLYNLEI
ncbi:DUF2164 domain-containing protein [Maledivibacter halophilus]|uniref:Uncharacterized conserved protein, DUF2164 family n=1 Tax=Maledivibacter halophilus TaxID=36842 RepID=A0A1T5MGN7_9FIRM|nr:DUF2164 domain-containing protein [Maledivibacter halophilus]SKC87039.1 Uncharacterized conserved protein, DUF2164 family [Maledivibacter halophilus]